MRINRHSIFLKLNLLFAIAIISITIVFLIFFTINKNREIGIIINDSRHVMRIVRTLHRHDHKKLSTALKEDGYNLIKDKSKILQNAQPIKYPKRLPSPLQTKLSTERLKILTLDSNTYFYLNFPRSKLLIKNRLHPNRTHWILFAYLAVISILLFTYLALKRALKPIKKLESEIKKFSEGNLDIDTKSGKKDEIASVGNQFYEAVQKIQKLQNSRTLFLRNIMHELKTPITKGKLSLALMEENDQSPMLEKVFNKIESLVNEMTEIEKITTGDIVIIKSEHRLIDIIDEAKDLLYLKDDQITHNITDQTIFCDFKLFSLVVKNLIDNGIKYSDNHIVEIISDFKSIQFSNQSAPLEHDFKYYMEPFFKGELKQTNKEGFGLGLYISSEIIKSHGYSLTYVHEDGNNIFTITTYQAV